MGRYFIDATLKGPAHIASPLFKRELALGPGISDPLQQAGTALDIHGLSQLACNFMGLVKTTLTKA